MRRRLEERIERGVTWDGRTPSGEKTNGNLVLVGIFLFHPPNHKRKRKKKKEKGEKKTLTTLPPSLTVTHSTEEEEAEEEWRYCLHFTLSTHPKCGSSSHDPYPPNLLRPLHLLSPRPWRAPESTPPDAVSPLISLPELLFKVPRVGFQQRLLLQPLAGAHSLTHYHQGIGQRA